MKMAPGKGSDLLSAAIAVAQGGDVEANSVLNFRREQISRIIKSTTFRNSPMLQKIMEFIFEGSELGGDADLTEYSIATQVLGRKADFDPSADTTVRTQVYRLRAKLKEYYASEGAADQLIVQIPKGHYLPVFSVRSDTHDASSTNETESALKQPASGSLRTSIFSGRIAQPSWFLFGSYCAIAILAVLLGLAVDRFLVPPRVVPVPAAAIGGQLMSFWKKPSSENGVVVAFTNPEFLESKSGLLSPYFGPVVADRGASSEQPYAQSKAGMSQVKNRDEPLYFEDGFTGTGEVFAASWLAETLQKMGIRMTLVRSRAVHASDFREHDVVFIGSPHWNGLLSDVSIPSRFVFRESAFLWGGEFEDTWAKSPAPRNFKIVRDDRNGVILSDYALFQVFPAPSTGHRIIVLAGIGTTGTQGAAAFATSNDGLTQARRFLGLTNRPSDPLPDYFECLLKVDAAGGVDALRITPLACNKSQ